MISDKTFMLRVMSINGVFYDGEAVSVVVPMDDGEICIMAGHEKMILAVSNGDMRIRTPKGKVVIAVLGNGSVQVESGRVIVLADTAERPEDIDINRAKEALEIAKEELRQQQSIKEYYLSQTAMARALNRIRAASKYN